MPFQEVPHTADLAIRVTAATRGDLFCEAVRAMAAVMAECPPGPGREEKVVDVAADSDTDLMYVLLSELLSWGDALGVVWVDADIEPEVNRVRAVVRGVPVHECEAVGPPLKAVTYHGLEVGATVGGWEATVVFDV